MLKDRGLNYFKKNQSYNKY